MANKITYTNKERLIDNPSIAEENKVTDTDMNEIKQVVNSNADELEDKVDKIEGKGLSANDFTDEYKEQIEALQTENTRLKATLPTTTGTGETITLDKTAEMEFVKPPLPRGNSTQETTEGYNWLGFVNGTYTASGITAVVKDGEITLSGTGTNTPAWVEIPIIAPIPISSNFYLYAFNTESIGETSSGGNQNYVSIRVGTADNANRAQVTLDTINAKNMFIQSSEITITSFRIRGNTNVTLNNVIVKPMLALSDNLNYEKYTYGASPNPNYKQDVANVTGDVEVLVQNKNRMKLVFSNDTNKFANLDFEHTDSSFSLKGTANYTYKIFDFANNFKFEYGKNYSLSMNILGTNAGIQVQYRAFNSLNQLIYQLVLNSSNNYKVTNIFNSNDNIHHSSLTIENLVNGGTYDLIANLQLEGNEIATTYIPHKEQTLPLTLGNIELCKIGDYQDYIYKENGKWYKNPKVIKQIFNGTENWNLQSINANGIANFSLSDAIPTYNVAQNVNNYISDYFIPQASGISSTTTEGFMINNTGVLFFRIKSERAGTLAAFKSWLSEHNVSVYSIITTGNIPIEITDTTLISQLEAIAEALSYEEQTNITGSSSEANPMFNVEAYQSIKLVLQEISNAVVALGGV